MGTADPRALIRRLELMPGTLQGLALPLGDDARWKPDAETWSALEICCHLADEEREDFRPRLLSTLQSPDAAWQPLDLERVAERRGYNERDLREVIEDFRREREASLGSLRSLQSPDWSNAHVHPKLGPIRAGDLLAAWAAHDAAHLRQIASRLIDLAKRDAGEYHISYAF